MVLRRTGTGLRLAALSVVVGSLAACSTTSHRTTHSKEYFSESEYGVKASKRVVYNGPVPKGGGREMVGDPYTVKGRVYVPRVDPHYNRVGLASWYGSAFHGRYTSNGEVYDKNALTAAHPTLPLPSYARVTNLDNGSSVIVRINDRGPFDRGRIIDLSSKTADLLDVKGHGTAKVRVQYVGMARLDGQDEAFLMASYVPKGGRLPAGQIAPGVMVASADNMVPSSALPEWTPPPQPRPHVLALDNTAPSVPQFQAIDQPYGALPDVGPIPADRPSFGGDIRLPRSLMVAGYAEDESQGRAGPFNAVLNDSPRLTAEQIRRSYHRHQND